MTISQNFYWRLSTINIGLLLITTLCTCERKSSQPVDSVTVQSKIAFYSHRDGNSEIYTMNADGTNQTRLTYNDAIDEAPQWSPDGSKIAFQSMRDGNWEIYIIDADGSNLMNLTDDSGNDRTPLWSPDGSKIAFQSDRGDPSLGYDIYIMNADGSGPMDITHMEGIQGSHAWRPDGEKLLFQTWGVNGRYCEIYTVNQDGTDKMIVGESGYGTGDYFLTWSHDGSGILFCSRMESEYDTCLSDICDFDIYRMNADGTDLVNLTNNTWEDFGAACSPDGEKIVVYSSQYGSIDIFTINYDGSNYIRLTDNEAKDWPYIFTPDSKKIVFDSWRDGNPEIYIMNADGTNQVNLTNNPGNDYFGSWWPVR